MIDVIDSRRCIICNNTQPEAAFGLSINQYCCWYLPVHCECLAINLTDETSRAEIILAEWLSDVDRKLETPVIEEEEWLRFAGPEWRLNQRLKLIDHDGVVVFTFRGKIHRENGPAIIYPNGEEEYWLHGEPQSGTL